MLNVCLRVWQKFQIVLYECVTVCFYIFISIYETMLGNDQFCCLHWNEWMYEKLNKDIAWTDWLLQNERHQIHIAEDFFRCAAKIRFHFESNILCNSLNRRIEDISRSHRRPFGDAAIHAHIRSHTFNSRSYCVGAHVIPQTLAILPMCVCMLECFIVCDMSFWWKPSHFLWEKLEAYGEGDINRCYKEATYTSPCEIHASMLHFPCVECR